MRVGSKETTLFFVIVSRFFTPQETVVDKILVLVSQETVVLCQLRSYTWRFGVFTDSLIHVVDSMTTLGRLKVFS